MFFEIQYTDDHVKETITLKFLLELSSKTAKTVRLKAGKQDSFLQLVLRTNGLSHSYGDASSFKRSNGPSHRYGKEDMRLLLSDLIFSLNTEMKMIKKCMISENPE